MKKPAIAGADVAAVLGWVFVCTNDVVFYSYRIFYAMRMALIAIPVYWVLGLFLCWLLLLFLKPQALTNSRGPSLPSFALAGALIPMFFYVPFSWMLAQGSFAPFTDPNEKPHTFFVLACLGFIGAASASAAWRTVPEASSLPRNKKDKEPDQH